MFIAAEDLRRVFEQFGRVERVWVAQNPPGYAFVGFENDMDAQQAWRFMDGKTLDNRRIRVNVSFKHNPMISPNRVPQLDLTSRYPTMNTVPSAMGPFSPSMNNDWPSYRSVGAPAGPVGAPLGAPLGMTWNDPGSSMRPQMGGYQPNLLNRYSSDPRTQYPSGGTGGADGTAGISPTFNLGLLSDAPQQSYRQGNNSMTRFNGDVFW